MKDHYALLKKLKKQLVRLQQNEKALRLAITKFAKKLDVKSGVNPKRKIKKKTKTNSKKAKTKKSTDLSLRKAKKRSV